MSDENREQHYAFDLVRKYEQMLAQNESYYFDVEEFEDIIDYYCSENKFNTALKVIQYAYTLFPDNGTMLLREAQLLASIGSLGKAMTKLRILEKFEPRNTEVFLTMASIQSQLRDHQKAIDLYKRALSLGDEEFEDEIYLEIALEYENMSRFDRAIETLHDALEKNPENESLLYELAYCYEVGDKTNDGIDFFSAFTEKYPFSFPGWYNLGNAHQRFGNYEKAIECYDFSIAIQDDFVPAYINKAQAYFKMERFNEAIQTFEETYTFEQPTAPIYCYIGECFEKMGEYDKSLFYYRKSLQQDELFPDAYIGLGLVLSAQDQHDDALAYLHHATTLDPANVDFRLFYAEALQRAGRLEQAHELYQELLPKNHDNEDFWLDYTDFFASHNQLSKALEVLDEGWQKNQSSVSLGYRKVAYLMMAGRTEEAQELLVRMMTVDPSSVDELSQYYPPIKENILFIDLCRQFKS